MNLKALTLKDKNGKAFGQEMYNMAEESKIREVTCVIYEVMEMKANHSMDPKAMPFDGKRMIYGGFKVMVDL